jgi:hypothetical protein
VISDKEACVVKQKSFLWGAVVRACLHLDRLLAGQLASLVAKQLARGERAAKKAASGRREQLVRFL